LVILDAQLSLSNTSGSVPPRLPLGLISHVVQAQSVAHEKVYVPTLKPFTARAHARSHARAFTHTHTHTQPHTQHTHTPTRAHTHALTHSTHTHTRAHARTHARTDRARTRTHMESTFYGPI
jgi:hypothetical protein